MESFKFTPCKTAYIVFLSIFSIFPVLGLLMLFKQNIDFNTAMGYIFFGGLTLLIIFLCLYRYNVIIDDEAITKTTIFKKIKILRCNVMKTEFSSVYFRGARGDGFNIYSEYSRGSKKIAMKIAIGSFSESDIAKIKEILKSYVTFNL